jgi:hypothetical protein
VKLAQQLAADRETLKRLEGKAKGRFIWDYYKIPIIVLAALILLGAIAVGAAVSHGKTALYAVFVNADRLDTGHDPAALEALLEQEGFPLGRRHVDLTADLTLGNEQDVGRDGQTIQVLAALFGISGLDFFAADPATFERYAVQEAFADLSRILAPEYWQDLPEADRIYCETSDGRRPLQGIILHAGSPLHEAGYFHGDVAVGAAINGENPDAALALIRALLR